MLFSLSCLWRAFTTTGTWTDHKRELKLRSVRRRPRHAASVHLFPQHGHRRLLLPAAEESRPGSRLPQQRGEGSEHVGPHVLLALLEAGQQGGADGRVEGAEKVAPRAHQRVQTLDGGATHLPAHVVVVAVLVVRVWVESPGGTRAEEQNM